MWARLSRATLPDGFGARHIVNYIDGVAVTPISCVTSQRFFSRGFTTKKKLLDVKGVDVHRSFI